MDTDRRALTVALVLLLAFMVFEVAAAVDNFALHDALRAIFEFVSAANRYADSSAPWQLAKLRAAATTAGQPGRLRPDRGLGR